jgi:hypothetical protein
MCVFPRFLFFHTLPYLALAAIIKLVASAF